MLRVPVGGGACVEVDASTRDHSTVVEAYARQGKLKGAQLKKIGQDILKLALLCKHRLPAETQAFIAFASEEARQSVGGWLEEAAERFGVTLIAVVDLDDARWGTQLFDVAQAVVHVAGVTKSSTVAPSQVRDVWHYAMVAALLDGYESVRLLTAEERTVLPHYTRLVAIGETVKALELEQPMSNVPRDLASYVARLDALVQAPFLDFPRPAAVDNDNLAGGEFKGSSQRFAGYCW